jgi:hypothetical protein
MQHRSRAVFALFALALALAGTPAQAQAQDQDARIAIKVLQAEVQKLQSELAALQAQVIKQDRLAGQAFPSAQFGNIKTKVATIQTERGSIVLDGENLTLTARNIILIGDKIELRGRDATTIKSTAISIEGETMTIKERGNLVLKGAKVLGN